MLYFPLAALAQDNAAPHVIEDHVEYNHDFGAGAYSYGDVTFKNYRSAWNLKGALRAWHQSLKGKHERQPHAHDTLRRDIPASAQHSRGASQACTGRRTAVGQRVARSVTAAPSGPRLKARAVTGWSNSATPRSLALGSG